MVCALIAAVFFHIGCERSGSRTGRSGALPDIDESDEDDEEEDDKPSSHSPPKRKAVNFEEIFGQVTGIVEKREAGYTTQDGFIVLKKRSGVKI